MTVRPGGQDDQVYAAILILFFVITVLAILGPIGVLVVLLTIIIGTIAGMGHAGSVVSSTSAPDWRYFSSDLESGWQGRHVTWPRSIESTYSTAHVGTSMA